MPAPEELSDEELSQWEKDNMDLLKAIVAVPEIDDSAPPMVDFLCGQRQMEQVRAQSCLARIARKKATKVLATSEKPKNLKEPKILDGKNSNSLKDSVESFETASGDLIVAATDKGIGYKDINEDRVGVSPEENLAVVADGVGGYADGDKAAEALVGSFLEFPDDLNDSAEAGSAQMTINNLNPKGGACFGTVRIIQGESGEKSIEIARAGDVKILLFDGKDLKPVTKDESLVRNLIKNGRITEDQALYHPERHVIANVVSPGYENVEPSITLPVKKGNLVLIITDGISDNLTPDEIRELIRGKGPEEIIRVLSDVTDDRMKNWRDIYELTEEEGGREKLGVFFDGYKSAPKPDNRGIAVIQVN